MREALSSVLGSQDDSNVDQVLAAAFFRKRPLQAGAAPSGGSSPRHVISIADYAATKRGQPK